MSRLHGFDSILVTRVTVQATIRVPLWARFEAQDRELSGNRIVFLSLGSSPRTLLACLVMFKGHGLEF